MSAMRERVAQLVRFVEQDERRRGVLSTGERIAVALVLDRAEWLAEMGYSLLDAVDRLGPVWLEAARGVRRAGWNVSSTPERGSEATS